MGAGLENLKPEADSGVFSFMETLWTGFQRTGKGFPGLARTLILGLGLLGATAVQAEEALLVYSDLTPRGERFGLDPRGGFEPQPAGELTLAMLQGDPAEQTGSSSPSGPSPFLAGAMSAIIPGTGQLVQGQNRGWLYLGIEIASWFTYGSLRSAGSQAEEDYRQFADSHWGWERYGTVTDCGEGLGPGNFEEESAQLMELYENTRGQFYDDIGSQDIYACGWDDQGNRGSYRAMQSDADNLYNASEFVVAVIVLNHLVSAVDAAKSASNRRKAEGTQSINWQVSPTPQGDLALKVELNRTF
jgi:hypothetical protein